MSIPRGGKFLSIPSINKHFILLLLLLLIIIIIIISSSSSSSSSSMTHNFKARPALDCIDLFMKVVHQHGRAGPLHNQVLYIIRSSTQSGPLHEGTLRIELPGTLLVRTWHVCA